MKDDFRLLQNNRLLPQAEYLVPFANAPYPIGVHLQSILA
ncbi:unnamed protein product [Brugia timori]|uniref:Bm13324 n=2 Tax=Brugia TaxID=6278 RepID=A0A1I9G5X4_BRUMA|nr:Bm13324 [Brugia malayi]VDO39305.1 unnamed protein product [Brugia timori]